MADKEKPEMVLKFKREDPEQFHCLVKMHLSFLLDMNTDECDCSFLFDHLYPGDHGTPKREGSLLQSSKGTGITNKKGIMEGATLTMEGVCQIFQIIQFLDRTNNIEQIGLFRKTGNLQKQKVLKERLNRGVPMDLDQGEFSVHECASVLKTFLSELPEPLLTDRFFHAHCQVANKIIKYFAPNHSAESSDCNDTLSYDERTKLFKETDDFRRCVESLQLLFLLIPDANYNLLKDMLKFLRRITHHQEKNKMSASNLGTIFATHLMCPRKLSAESLQSNHQLYSSAVTFMIQQSDILFNIPEKVVQDVLAHRKRTSDKGNSSILRHVSGDRNVQSPIVNTIFSFVDRQRSKEDSNELTTDTAIAQLYAQVQAMPESAQKKRLIAKLNDNKGFSCNTSTLPIRYRNTSNSVNGTFEHLKNFLTPRFSRRNTSMTENKNIFGEKKSAHSGSYNIQHSDKVANNFEKHTPLNSYTPIRDGIDGSKKNELQFHEIPDIVKPKILDEPNDIASKLSRKGPEVNVSNVSEISTTSSNLWREGEQILKGEIDLSESMQLCLDGEDPIDDVECNVKENDSQVSVESTANIIGSKGMIGIKNYLKVDTSSHPKVGGSVARGDLRKNIHNSNVESEELHISPSYADRVSALLRTPPVLSVTGNKENKSLCNETNSCDAGSEPKLPRKRSLTEMIGHNPLSKERKPLGQRRCFETDL